MLFSSKSALIPPIECLVPRVVGSSGRGLTSLSAPLNVSGSCYVNASEPAPREANHSEDIVFIRSCMCATTLQEKLTKADEVAWLVLISRFEARPSD